MKRKLPQNIRRIKRQLAKAKQQELYNDAIMTYRFPPARPGISNAKI